MFNSNDAWEQLDLFEWFKDVVDSSIHDMIKDKLGFDPCEKFSYRALSFFPIYTKCKKTGGKILKSKNIRVRKILNMS